MTRIDVHSLRDGDILVARIPRAMNNSVARLQVMAEIKRAFEEAGKTPPPIMVLDEHTRVGLYREVA